MKKHILSGITFLWCTIAYGQVYYVSDDSVSLKIEVVAKEDSVDAYKITFVNKTNAAMFLCKPASRKFPFYINTVDGPLTLGCGCEYGFSQDDGNRRNEREVVKIAGKDTLRFEIKQADIAGRPMLKKELAARNKYIKIDYVLSDDPVLFRHKGYVLGEFMSRQRRLMVFLEN